MAWASSIASNLTMSGIPAERAAAAVLLPRSGCLVSSEAEGLRAMFSPHLHASWRRERLARFECGSRARTQIDPESAKVNSPHAPPPERRKKRPRLAVEPGSVRPAAVKMGKGRLPARRAASHDNVGADVNCLTFA